MSGPPELRRTDKLMPEAEARALLEAAYCGRLATVGPDGYPYCVPLLHVMLDGGIWMHNARVRGHLRINVEHEARACFEIDEAGEVFPYGRFECDTSMGYRSVIAFGRVRLVEAEADKQRFFDALMAKYTRAKDGTPRWQRPNGFYPRLGEITVYALSIERLTGKESPLFTAREQWPSVDRTRSPNAVPPGS
jgi:uncharacterized protein